MNTSKSSELFKRAQEHIPGGVNSPARAFKSVGRDPLFITRAEGSKLYDANDNEYIDYVLSWGPMIVGHANPKVTEALKDAVSKGTSFGAPTEIEIELAELVKEAYPSMDMVRMVSSGTEATMSALRLARGFTGRDKIIKFEGCYHGHADSLLVKAGSGLATLGIPDCPGVPADIAKHTIVARFNDIDTVKKLLGENKDQVAAIIVEPVVGNMGCVPPVEGFLNALKDAASDAGALLILDEVMTGFRVALGGAQQLFGVKPDITCLGKVIGGGMPVGAYGGRKDVMEKIAPLGPVYQAGTLSGNPLAMTAGIETIKLLKEPGAYDKLEKMSAKLVNGLKQAASDAGAKVSFNRVGSMFTVFFNDEIVKSWDESGKSDTDKFAAYFREMMDRGIYLPCSQFEAAFLSLAHTDDDIEKTIQAARESFKAAA